MMPSAEVGAVGERRRHVAVTMFKGAETIHSCMEWDVKKVNVWNVDKESPIVCTYLQKDRHLRLLVHFEEDRSHRDSKLSIRLKSNK
jgi:hypothetical protein